MDYTLLEKMNMISERTITVGQQAHMGDTVWIGSDDFGQIVKIDHENQEVISKNPENNKLASFILSGDTLGDFKKFINEGIDDSDLRQKQMMVGPIRRELSKADDPTLKAVLLWALKQAES